MNTKEPVRYRYVTPGGRGRWRETLKEARVAAAKAGHGSIDEHSGTVFLNVLVVIEGSDGRVLK
ncbi:MAG: hypothetical protein V4530_05975 [Pseudomonadota bacterium]